MQTAAFSTTTLGTNICLTGDPTLTTIEILGIVFQCSVATTVTLKAGSTSLTGAMAFVTGGGFQLPLNDIGAYFTIPNGDDFIVSLSGLVGQCGGFVIYNRY